MNRLKKEQRRKNMQSVKSSGSKIEIKLLKELSRRKLRYRKNVKNIIGKPDVAFKKYKIVVFVDSEFWHGKNWNTKKHEHKSNIAFWHKKIECNIQRDKEVNRQLKKEGWKVLRFWGKDIQKKLSTCINKIETVIDEREK